MYVDGRVQNFFYTRKREAKVLCEQYIITLHYFEDHRAHNSPIWFLLAHKTEARKIHIHSLNKVSTK